MVVAVVASGASTSSAVTLFPADKRWSLYCPSMSPNTVRVEASASSGGGTDFGTLYTAADQPALVTSGTARPAWSVPFVPVTPFLRVSLNTAASDTGLVRVLPSDGAMMS